MTAPARAAVAVLLVVAAGGAWMWWSSPERQIRRALAGLADGLSHEAVASPLGAAAAVAEVQSFLSEDVVLEPGGRRPPVAGRPAVLGAAARIRTAVAALRLEFADLEVRVTPDGTVASVEGTVSVAITDRAGQQRTDAREFTAEMRLVEGRWVVARARAIDALEPVS